MGFEKLMFWKKKDSFSFDDGPLFGDSGKFGKQGAGLSGLGDDSLGGLGLGDDGKGFGGGGSGGGMDYGSGKGAGFGEQDADRGGFGQHNDGMSTINRYPTTEQMADSVEPSASLHSRMPGNDGMGMYGNSQQAPNVSRGFEDSLKISNEMLSKDLALISSKLDTLRVQIESMNHRIANIEKIAYQEEKDSRRW